MLLTFLNHVGRFLEVQTEGFAKGTARGANPGRKGALHSCGVPFLLSPTMRRDHSGAELFQISRARWIHPDATRRSLTPVNLDAHDLFSGINHLGTQPCA